MLERVRRIDGDELTPKGYLDDFWPHFQQIDDMFWKLERIQDFREPEEPSWVAMTAGDWDRALALADETITGNPQEMAFPERLTRRRLRIVEQPVTPYIQWEMHMLRIRGEVGEQIRVLDARAVRHLEVERSLPELVVLGTLMMYEVLYDGTGTLSGARRIADREAIDACRKEIEELFGKGEDLLTYFEREIAPLPPPAVQS